MVSFFDLMCSNGVLGINFLDFFSGVVKFINLLLCVNGFRVNFLDFIFLGCGFEVNGIDFIF